MPSQDWNLMAKLVNQIYQKPDAEPFRDAVDWKGLGLYDYPQLVKKPMDLGQIKRRIEKEEYASLHDCGDDVRLVWDNCKTYNADGSDFYLLAESMSKKFEDKFAKLLKELNVPERGADVSATSAGGGSGSGKSSSGELAEPSLDEKKLFARRLYKITKEDLGKVIIDLDNICPAAITKNSAEDQVEINVDNISAKAFQQVMAFVTSCVGENGGRKKKSAPSSNKNKKARTS
jgi:hypothetical protein